ncbi:MAG TPA: rRNA adenine N-6-methyltransferase family protein [Gemmatimonadales bacterium]
MTPLTQVPRRNGTRSEQLLLFGRNFLKHPRMLGSVIPSSRFLVDRVLGQVDWPRAGTIVEYGPGVGTLTREILRRLGPEATLVAIETNGDFVRYLQRTVADRRLQVVEGSAAETDAILAARGLRHADYVISGIPYSTMPPEIRDRILRTTHDVLQPDGAFLVYQFTRAVLPYLRQTFPLVDQKFEPRNIMPARLFFCRRHPDGRGSVRPREPRPRARAAADR